MDRPLQLGLSPRQQQAAALAMQREQEADAAARAAARKRQDAAEREELEVEIEAWEAKVARLLDEGRDHFGHDADHWFREIAERRDQDPPEKVEDPERYAGITPREAFRAAVGQVLPLNLIVATVGLQVYAGLGFNAVVPAIIAFSYIALRLHLRTRAILVLGNAAQAA